MCLKRNKLLLVFSKNSVHFTCHRLTISNTSGIAAITRLLSIAAVIHATQKYNRFLSLI